MQPYMSMKKAIKLQNKLYKITVTMLHFTGSFPRLNLCQACTTILSN